MAEGAVVVRIGRQGGGGAVGEWVMLDFQGAFVLRADAPRAADGAAVLGELRVSGGKATVAVGNSLLEGSVVDLHTPILVCQRGTASSPQEQQHRQHHIVGYLTKKIVFSKRPKTVC